MTKKIKANPDDVVKKDIMYIVAAISFISGFIGGVIYTEYNANPGASKHTNSIDHVDHAGHQHNAGQSLSGQQVSQVTELEKKARSNPKNADNWTQLGNLYFDSNQPKKAIKAYKKSLKLKSKNSNVWTDLGVMYRRNQQPAEAVAAFAKAGKYNPNHEKSRLNMGIILLHDLNDKIGAIKAWTELLKINPSAKIPNGQSLSDLVSNLKSELKK